ncbi:hypothetical protein QL093DRAFT_2258338 [Fusarium oxysporum]|nr:hypothetical protein QL093DRAFT_2258338 [Fusarium oxysporum]
MHIESLFPAIASLSQPIVLFCLSRSPHVTWLQMTLCAARVRCLQMGWYKGGCYHILGSR